MLQHLQMIPAYLYSYHSFLTPKSDDLARRHQAHSLAGSIGPLSAVSRHQQAGLGELSPP